jgi:hypothetical protein
MMVPRRVILTISIKLVDKTNFVENLPEERCASWCCSGWSGCWPS